MGFELSPSQKNKRRADINGFVAKYGRGDRGLNNSHKKCRVEKFLGAEAEKVRGHGANPNSGRQFFKQKDKRAFVIDKPGLYDRIPDEVLDSLADFPDDPNEIVKTGTSKILDVEVRDNGSIVVSGIMMDGNERNIKLRATWGVMVSNDASSAKAERKQHQKGVLKEVSDRTMALHDAEGYLDVLFEDTNVDTDPDKPGQI